MSEDMNNELLDDLSEPVEEPTAEAAEAPEQETAEEATEEDSTETTAEAQESHDDAETEETEAKAKPDRVPVGELIEERRKRQALEQQAMELQARLAAQEQIQEEIRRLREENKEKPAEEELPDYDADPLQHLKAKTDKQEEIIRQQIEAQKQAQEAQQQQIQQQQAIQQVVGAISQHEQEFVNEHDDYYNALEHVRGIQRENLAGLGLSPEQVEAEITRAEIETGIAALQQNVDPAAYVYEIAKRMGYSKAEKSPVDDAAKMDAVEKGTKAQSVEGGAPSVKDLAEIEDDDEFEAAMRQQFGE